MAAFGAVDLFAGSNSITGSNLWQTDKNPLNEISEGIEDVVGKQAQGLGGGITQIVDELINSILGFPLLGNGPQGQGGPNDIYTFFGNILDFLGGLNPLDPNFLDPANILAAAESFIETILHPTNLLAPLVTDASQGLGMVGFVPMENLALDLIGSAVGSAQALIDAILRTVGIPTGTVDDVFNYFTDFLKMFTTLDVTDPNWVLNFASGAFDPTAAVEHFIANMLDPSQYFGNLSSMLGLPDFTNPAFDPFAAVETFVLDRLHPSNLLAPLVPVGSADLPSLITGHVPMDHLAIDLISGEVELLIGNAQEVIDAILTTVIPGYVPGAGTADDVTRYFNDVVKMLGDPPLTTGIITLIPCLNVSGNLDNPFDPNGRVYETIGDTTQGIVDTVTHAVTALTPDPANPFDLGDLRQHLSGMTNFLGFTLPVDGLSIAPIGSVAWTSQANNIHITQRPATKPCYVGVDQGADAVFPFSQLTGDPFPTIGCTPAASVIGMIGTPDAGVKQSIAWHGDLDPTLTGLYLNLYQVDAGTSTATRASTATGVLTLLYESDNLVGKVTSDMAWNYHNFPSGSLQTVSLGIVPPAGPPTRFRSMPTGGTFALSFNGPTTNPIPYDAPAATVAAELAALTSIGAGNVRVHGPAGGPYIVTFTGALAHLVQPLLVGSWALLNGNPSITDLLMTKQGDYYAAEMQVTGPAAAVYKIGGVHHAATVHPLAFPQGLSATRAPATHPPPVTIPAPNYLTPDTPWFALCGEAGKTEFMPLGLTVADSGTFDPTLYPWANYFDVVAYGAGGGGRGGNVTTGAWGGLAAVAVATTATKAQAGTAPWTITLGEGGAGGPAYGGAAPGGNGQPGGATTVAIPGQPTITAAGGFGGFADMGRPGFGAGEKALDVTYADAYGNPNTYNGGAGGSADGGPGGQPGGGGAGGSGGLIGAKPGGKGGKGGVYIVVYA